MFKNSCFVFCVLFSSASLLSQSRYVGGTAAFNHTSNTANSGLFQNNTNKTTSLLILPEYGILNDRGSMFGLSLGFYLSRNNTQGNISNLVAGVLGVNYRKLFSDGKIRPFLETGLLGYVGQFNPSNQGAEYFQGRVPLKAGLMFGIDEKWHLLSAVEVLGLIYTRSGGFSSAEFFLANRGNIGFSVVRLF